MLENSVVLYLAVIAGIFITADAVDYCKLTCRHGSMHTMCKYPSPEPGPNCIEPHDQGLTDAEKDAIVRKHNECRQTVASGNEKRGFNGPQPPAVHMPNLTWDDELATVAQRLANRCTFAYDPCRRVERFEVGQNVAIVFSEKSQPHHTVEDLVKSWCHQVRMFDKRSVSSFKFFILTANYSQMVWADTIKIGCGRIKYKNDLGWNTILMVCNYGPAGNLEGKKMYEIKK